MREASVGEAGAQVVGNIGQHHATVLLGPVAERPPLLGRDARGERRLQEQPGLPREPEQFFEARSRGSPGPVEGDDGDDGDDDDGDDDAQKR